MMKQEQKQMDYHYETKYLKFDQAILQIVKEEGFGALFKGLSASMIGLTHVVIYFPLYEQTKEYLKRRNKTERLSDWDIFVATTFSKTVTSCLSYPHEVIRS